MNKDPDARLTISWSPSRENWLLMMTGVKGTGPEWMTATYSEHTLDKQQMRLLLAAVRREMESWLF